MSGNDDQKGYLVPLSTFPTYAGKWGGKETLERSILDLFSKPSFRAGTLFALARNAAVQLADVVGDEKAAAALRGESGWSGSPHERSDLEGNEPAIGLYISTTGPVSAAETGVLFQRLESAIRRSFGSGGRYEVSVEIEQLSEGSIFAQFGVKRRKRPGKKQKAVPWSRQDRLALFGVLVAILALLSSDGSPLRKSNDKLLASGNTTAIIYASGVNSIAVTPQGIFVSPELAPRAVGTEVLAPSKPGQIVRDAEIDVRADGVFAGFADTDASFPVVDRRVKHDKWKSGARYVLAGSLRYDDQLPTGFEVRRAWLIEE